MTRRVLVTGASGFIGRKLVASLSEDWTVFAASRSGDDVGDAVGVQLDLRDESAFQRLPRPVDVVVHLAALIDAPSVNDYNATNVMGTYRILAYAEQAGAGTFVYGSTGGVYGSSALPCREGDGLNPQDDYAVSKAQAEMLVSSSSSTMRKVILRYCAPYALGTPNPITKVLGSLIRAEEIWVSVGMYPRYNPLHLDDAVEMSVRALELPSDCVLNIAGDEPTTFAGIALIAGEALGLSPRFRLVDLAQTIPYYRNDTYLEPTAAYERLGYRPRTRLRQGIAEMARQQAARARPQES